MQRRGLQALRIESLTSRYNWNPRRREQGEGKRGNIQDSTNLIELIKSIGPKMQEVKTSQI